MLLYNKMRTNFRVNCIITNARYVEDKASQVLVVTTKSKEKMENLLIVAQVAVALSVSDVWTFRYHNVITEFKSFGLNDLTRNLVGVSKIALATLLITGIWFPSLVLFSSLLMGGFMIAAQGFHFKIKNTFIKHLPSLILLLLCAFIAIDSMN